LRAQKKRDLIARQVREMGLTNFQFVDAVDAKSLALDELRRDGRYDEATSRIYHSKGLTLNEIACSLSHGAAYTQIANAGHLLALVIEDDALFVTAELKKLKLSEVPSDFDVLLLNSFRYEDPPKGRLAENLYDASSYSGSAAAYVLSAAGARKLANAFLPVIHAADGLLGRCMELTPGDSHLFKQVGARTELRSYLVYPDCVLNGSTSHYHVSDVQC
jgi:glycosyl transferase family 25